MPELRPPHVIAQTEPGQPQAGEVDACAQQHQTQKMRQFARCGVIQPVGLRPGREIQRRRHGQQGQQQFRHEERPAGTGLVNIRLTQMIVQQAGIDAGAEADGKRQPGVAQIQPEDEHEIHELCRHQRENGDLHRRFDVLAGIEGRCQHLDHDQAEQTKTIGNQRLARHPDIMIGECAVMKQAGNQRHCQHRKRHRGRQSENESEPQAPVHQRRIFAIGLVGKDFERLGSRIVPSATPSRPVGNSIRRSA